MQRRRFIQILATATAGFNVQQLLASDLKPVHWQGYALGAEGRFTLYTHQPEQTKRILKICFQEIQRLESIFSLYQKQSEITQLNANGLLLNPDAAWLPLLDKAARAHQMTAGAFDPTIQNLWKLYAQHYKKIPFPQSGPSASELQKARASSGWHSLAWDTNEIRLHNKAQLSLNGIAQGFITDHITEILKNEGFKNVLVELGETRALGPHPSGRPWHLGIEKPTQHNELYRSAELVDRALATSSPYGTTFGNTSGSDTAHHLIDPRSGQPASQWGSLSVLAPTAAEADALSTGLCFASATEIKNFRSRHPELEVITQAHPAATSS
jgi:thiamine biosynthesis lipoprotein